MNGVLSQPRATWNALRDMRSIGMSRMIGSGDPAIETVTAACSGDPSLHGDTAVNGADTIEVGWMIMLIDM